MDDQQAISLCNRYAEKPEHNVSFEVTGSPARRAGYPILSRPHRERVDLQRPEIEWFPDEPILFGMKILQAPPLWNQEFTKGSGPKSRLLNILAIFRGEGVLWRDGKPVWRSDADGRADGDLRQGADACGALGRCGEEAVPHDTHKTVSQLCGAVTEGEDVQHASQIDVVLALWKNGLIV